jgi:hypothetical protein
MAGKNLMNLLSRYVIERNLPCLNSVDAHMLLRLDLSELAVNKGSHKQSLRNRMGRSAMEVKG